MFGQTFEIRKFDSDLFEKLKEQKKTIVQSFALSFPDKIQLIHEKSKIAIFGKSASSLDFFKGGDTEDTFQMATIYPKVLEELNQMLQKNTEITMFDKPVAFEEGFDILLNTNEQKFYIQCSAKSYDIEQFENSGFHIGVCPPHYEDIFYDWDDETRIDDYEDILYENFYKARKYFSTQVGGVGTFVQRKYDNMIIQLNVGVGDNGSFYLYDKDGKPSFSFDQF